MAVCKTFRYLLEKEFGYSFVKFLSAANKAKDIASSAQLHHETQVSVCLERVV